MASSGSIAASTLRRSQSERMRHIGVITAVGGTADFDAMARVAAFQQGQVAQLLQGTRTVPIVFSGAVDPVGVAVRAVRPGNATKPSVRRFR